MSNRKFWTMKDGSRIRIKDMEDEHLVNCIDMLERMHSKAINDGYSCLGILQGELAIEDCERGIDQLEEEGPDGINPLYSELVDEAKRRELFNGKPSSERRKQPKGKANR